ncbi:MAG: dienelactone hydrolase family protein [Rhodospirillales bacterium]|nr:MAG: dienelactone hydrolase family protein [Rhodospirillales bacterium]
MRVEDIAYNDGGTRLVGQLAVDETRPGRRPGVLVCHEGPGLTDHTKIIARRLAKLGYVAYAMDYHGDGRPLANPADTMARLNPWRADPTSIRVRAGIALKLLAARPEVDAGRMAAIGYCFGGTTALELARAGEDLRCVVGFHSGLATARPQDAVNIKAKVLVNIGAEDPIIPPEQRLDFEKEMRAANVDWRMILYGGAGHSFTNPAADARNMPGFKYHEPTDRRSWRAMLDLFDETLGPV